MSEPYEIIPKVWGHEEILVSNDLYTAKRLHLAAGFISSTHRHFVKDETFLCLAGTAFLRLEEHWHCLTQDSRERIRPGQYHCFGSFSGAILLEISTRHRDSDVERLVESHSLTRAEKRAILASLQTLGVRR